MKMLIEAVKVSIVAVLFAFSGAVFAQTSDGETPAVESVCDGQEGALLGLCIAYCEAMDCDSPDTTANPKACESVLANWARKADGAGIPCAGGDCRDQGCPSGKTCCPIGEQGPCFFQCREQCSLPNCDI